MQSEFVDKLFFRYHGMHLQEGNTILVVTHEHDIAQMCKRIVQLKDGVIIEDKKIKQVLASSYVQ